MNHNARTYRPEVDGLRALSVIPVVLYHAGFSTFGGGYVGVDVFFVISGFLIGGILHAEMQAGNLSIVRFYERRVRRIIPALTVVVLATLVAGAFVLLPKDYEALGKSAASTAIFYQNFYFWSSSGYFAGAAEMMPLLHTWSLAVEEQYYIVFPLFLMLLAGRQDSLKWLLLLGLVVSFALCVVLTARSPGAAFYLLPTRAWELLAGAAIAIMPWTPVPVLRQLFSVFGPGLILAAVLLYDSHTQFPGYAAALPVLGACLSIWAGAHTWGGRVLASAPMVYVGLLSYSIYLWHWPIFVLTKHALVSEHLTFVAAALGIGATWLLSHLTWRYVETPFRRGGFSQTRILAGGVASLAVIAIAGGAIMAMRGWPERFDEASLKYAAADLSLKARKCLDAAAKSPEFCTISEGSPGFILWGDSHAGAVLPALETVAAARGVSGVFAGFNGCPPVLETYPNLRGADIERCVQHKERVLKYISDSPAIGTVVLSAFWENYKVSPERMREILDRLKDKKVVVLFDVPAPRVEVPRKLAMSHAYGRDPGVAPQPKKLEGLAVLAEYPNVTALSLAPVLCPGGVCSLSKDGNALYADGNHLSEYAAREVVGRYLLGLPDLGGI
jgi:peptidoglycan/LPS O-acetylase OafA/YrhL